MPRQKIGGGKLKKMRLTVLLGSLVMLAVAGLSSPVQAATQIFTLRLQNQTFGPSGPFTMTICGTTAPMFFTIFAREESIVLWDDGHVEFHLKDTTIFVNSPTAMGPRIAQTQLEQIFVTGPGGLPMSSEFNFVETCGGASATPGLLFQVFAGFTVNQNGELTNLRFHT
jgi:hypothetical protein